MFKPLLKHRECALNFTTGVTTEGELTAKGHKGILEVIKIIYILIRMGVMWVFHEVTFVQLCTKMSASYYMEIIPQWN